MSLNTTVMATAEPGDDLSLSKYLTGAVTVRERAFDAGGPVLVIESGGGSRYRLRDVDDDDDRLLMEKPDGDDWQAFIRLDAQPTAGGKTKVGP